MLTLWNSLTIILSLRYLVDFADTEASAGVVQLSLRHHDDSPRMISCSEPIKHEAIAIHDAN